jgi:signal transduction histidine kinase
MPESQHPILISTQPPSRAQKRGALVAAVSMLGLFASVVPFGQIQLDHLNVFVPIVATTMFICDLITATLLYAQFAVLRYRALLALASGYLFTALVVVPYALTFPGAFSENGLLGAGSQTTGWLYIVWHMGLPATIIVYTVLKKDPLNSRVAVGSLQPAIGISILAVVLCVLDLTLFVTLRADELPVMVVNVTDLGGVASIVTASVLVLCAVAIVLLWLNRRSLLDLWLLVVSLAWLLDSMLLNVMGHRFDVAWYATRAFGIASASFVLLVLLAESTMLYAKLALSVLAQRRERESRLTSMDAITAAMAHEVKQPLGAIMANAKAGRRWLTKTPPALEEVRETLEDIAIAGERANEVIQSIRDMFKHVQHEGTLLDPNELIREALALVRSDLEAARVSVELDLDAQVPPVLGHRGQLQQVMLNLMSNATDAMRPVTDRARVMKVTSEPSLSSDGVELSVTDSGTGIELDNTERIFDAFFTTKPNGMGMGLAICRSIVDSHGGKLTVLPATPHGTVFCVTLPSVR